MKYVFNHRYIRLTQVITLLSAISLSSCKKLMEIPPNAPNRVSTERVYSDSLNVLGALTGIYASFGTGGFGGSINTAPTTLNTAMASDELLPNPQYPQLQQFSTNNILQNNGDISSMWATGYAGIYQCNAFLEGVTKSTGITGSFKQQVMAEVMLSRSLYYFNLVNQFGPVPIVTGTDFTVNAVVKRMAEDSVYAFIIRDLTSVLGMLTDKYPSAGKLRPNLNVAKAFLAKVYLYRGKWQQAADLSDQVIKYNPAVYDLIEPVKVFLDGSKEAIWQLPTLSTFTQTSDALNFVPYSSTDIPTYFLSSYLVNAFEPGDLRKQAWAGVNTVTSGNTTTLYYYPAKYKSRDLGVPPIEGYMMFRLGEQYLIRSEALAQMNLLDSARSGINRIRLRAGLGATPAVTQAQVLAAIEKERQTELFCELGNRWYDLKRTGRVNAVLSPIKPEWAATDALFPIPLNELQTNRFLTPNPGY